MEVQSERVETQDEDKSSPAPMENDINTAESGVPQLDGNKVRKARSPAWEHFEKIEIGGQLRAVCIHCKKSLGANSKNGTKHLLDHMKTCVYKRQRTINQCMLNPTKSSDGSVKLDTYNFNHEHARRALANMIILHEYPLSLVDHIGFKIYSNALQPLFKVCSRNTVKKDIFKIFEVERERTMKLLDMNKSRIAITTDMWTSNNQKRGFMTVTSHFIDDAWKLQSRLIRFIYVPCPHTADVLAEALMECMYDWNLDSKLSTLTVDNYSTNDSMIAIILDKLSYSSLMLDGRLFHMRCCAHILNLVVRDGLEVIKNSIEKIRYSVAFWLGTQKREKFLETAKQLRVPTSKMLELDCKTRWNSTYSMLKTAMIYKDVFPRLKQREPLYKEMPSESDWVKTNELVDKLGIFYDVTVLFSGTKYPTANLYFKNICAIRLAICDWLVSNQDDVKTMALQMQKKFEKYWDTMHGLMGVASILDPRYKMKQIEFLCPLIYGDNAAQEILKYKNILYDLIKEYRSKSQQSQHVQHESSVNNPSSRATVPKLDLVKQLDVFVSHCTTNTHVKSELDHYLDESLLPRNDDDDFDILCWWKSNGIKYPTLHDIARDILAIPISTVASESCFSTSGRIISPHRSRLHSKTVEALMCARDWLWSSYANDNDSAEKVSIQDEEVDTNEEHAAYPDMDASTSFFGVYDGHGGNIVAKFCAKYLHRQVLKNEAYVAGDIGTAVQKSFSRMDEMMCGQRGWAELNILGGKINKCTSMTKGNDQANDWGFEEGPHSNFTGPSSGSTACVAILRNNQLLVANAGDSHCAISRKGQVYHLSRDHKPDLELEKERILKAGGFVHAGRVNGMLNVSRAIGDMEFKQNKFLPAEKQIVTATPDINNVELCDDDEFIVLTSGGIWNCMSIQQVVDYLHEQLSLASAFLTLFFCYFVLLV